MHRIEQLWPWPSSVMIMAIALAFLIMFHTAFCVVPTCRYITAIAGATNHWRVRGGHIVYKPSRTSFRSVGGWVTIECIRTCPTMHIHAHPCIIHACVWS